MTAALDEYYRTFFKWLNDDFIPTITKHCAAEVYIGEGLRAWRDGKPREANPHPVGTLARNSWDAGWLQLENEP